MTTPLEIPISLDVPLYTERVTLDGREFILAFDYSERESRWYLSLSDTDGNKVASGIKIVCDVPLLRKRVGPKLPPGNLIASDLSGGGVPPTFADLGRRVRLFYQPATIANGGTAPNEAPATTEGT